MNAATALCVFLMVVSGTCVVLAIESVSQSYEEFVDIQDALMPFDAYLQSSRIGRKYGWFVEHYWRVGVYERNRAWAQHFYDRLGREQKQEIDNALAKGFVVNDDIKRDEDIKRRYERLQERLPDLLRREEFWERIWDTMAYIGCASLAGAAAWFVYRRGGVDA